MQFQRLPVPGVSNDQPSAVERILSVSKKKQIEAFDLADALGRYVGTSQFVTKHEATDWLSGILSWLPETSQSAVSLAGIVLEALIAVGFFGIGTSFGQRVLLQLPERNVLVPGVGRVKIGGLWQPIAEPAFAGSIMPKANVTGDEVSLLEVIGLVELVPETMVELRQIIGRACHGVAIEDCVEAWQKHLIVLTCSLNTVDLKWRMSSVYVRKSCLGDHFLCRK